NGGSYGIAPITILPPPGGGARLGDDRDGQPALADLFEFGLEVADLLQQVEDDLDAGQVDTHVLRQVLDLPEALDVAVAVEAVAAMAGGFHQPQALVESQRLRVHPDATRRDADHVERFFVSISFRHRNGSRRWDAGYA